MGMYKHWVSNPHLAEQSGLAVCRPDEEVGNASRGSTEVLHLRRRADELPGYDEQNKGADAVSEVCSGTQSRRLQADLIVDRRVRYTED